MKSIKAYTNNKLKIVIFFFIFIFTFFCMQKIFIPKWKNFYNPKSMISNFYRMPQNSLSILFLGSSQVAAAISPMQLYEEQGYLSYNLSMEQQNLLSSYYWLKESLSYQTPQVVIVDVLYLFEYENGNTFDEAFFRKAFDYMRWSLNKVEAINEICKVLPQSNKLDYYFPLVRYHDRWKEIEEEDFKFAFHENSSELRGFCPTSQTQVFEFYGIEEPGEDIRKPLQPEMLTYLDKMVELCKEHDIELILIKTPQSSGKWTRDKSNSVEEYAQKKEIKFIDFNKKSLYNTVGFDCSMDFMDDWHMNLSGAKKLTNYMGYYLRENYEIETNQYVKQSWDEDLAEYKDTLYWIEMAGQQ